MDKKIFNDQGFLTTDGKSFVNSYFTKEAMRVLETATDYNDLLVISGLLKGIIAEKTSQLGAELLIKAHHSEKVK